MKEADAAAEKPASRKITVHAAQVDIQQMPNMGLPRHGQCTHKNDFQADMIVNKSKGEEVEEEEGKECNGREGAGDAEEGGEADGRVLDTFTNLIFGGRLTMDDEAETALLDDAYLDCVPEPGDYKNSSNDSECGAEVDGPCQGAGY